MVGWHHRLDGHEFEQALGVGDGQDGLACCSPWGRREGLFWGFFLGGGVALSLKNESSKFRAHFCPNTLEIFN